MRESSIKNNGGKIGIMSWWHNANYGGFLQGLALQTWLERQGYAAELVNFAWPRADFKWWHVLGLSRWTRLRHLAARPLLILRRVLVDGYVCQRVRRVLNTRRVLEKFAKSSPQTYPSIEDIGAAGRYAALLVGSDQVWNTQWYADGEKARRLAPFLLEGLDGGVRKASYASSVGRASVGADAPLFARNLAQFDAISVREKVNVEELERLSGKKVEWVADPTLLLSADEWRDLLGLGGGAAAAKPHVCVYWLSLIDGRWRHLADLARRTGLPVHIYTEHNGLWPAGGIAGCLRHMRMRLCLALNPRVKVRTAASAVDFLRDLSTAELVVSDSFHALMFSTIFGRKARIVVPRERAGMKNRMEDFLRLTSRTDILASEDELARGLNITLPPLTKSEQLCKWIKQSQASLRQAVG